MPLARWHADGCRILVVAIVLHGLVLPGMCRAKPMLRNVSSLSEEAGAVISAVAVRSLAIFMVGYVEVENEGRNMFAAMVNPGGEIIAGPMQWGTAYDDQLTSVTTSDHYVFAGGYTDGVMEDRKGRQDVPSEGRSAFLVQMSSSRLKKNKVVQFPPGEQESVDAIRTTGALVYAAGRSGSGAYLAQLSHSLKVAATMDLAISPGQLFMDVDAYGDVYVYGLSRTSLTNPSSDRSSPILLKVDPLVKTTTWRAAETSSPHNIQPLGLVLDYNSFPVVLFHDADTGATTLKKFNRNGRLLWELELGYSVTASLGYGLDASLYVLRVAETGEDTIVARLPSGGVTAGREIPVGHFNRMAVDRKHGNMGLFWIDEEHKGVATVDLVEIDDYILFPPTLVRGHYDILVKLQKPVGSDWTPRLAETAADLLADFLQLQRNAVAVTTEEDDPYTIWMRLPVEQERAQGCAELLRRMQTSKINVTLPHQQKEDVFYIVGDVMVADGRRENYDLTSERDRSEKILLTTAAIVIAMALVAAIVLGALVLRRRKRHQARMSNVARWLGQTQTLIRQSTGFEQDADALSSVHSDDF